MMRSAFIMVLVVIAIAQDDGCDQCYCASAPTGCMPRCCHLETAVASPAPPLCTKEFVSNVQGFMFDLDGTVYGDLRKHNSTWGGFIENAIDMHRLLVKKNIPFMYLSNSASKGAQGVDAKFRGLGLAEGIGQNRAFTAGDGLAAFLVARAPSNSRILVLDSSSTFNGETDSCLRVIKRTQTATKWILRVDLQEDEAKEWSAAAKKGEPVFVAYCVDNDLDAKADGGAQGWDYTTLMHSTWLLTNGATLVGHAPDVFGGATMDPAFPELLLNHPGPGTFLSLLREASFLHDQKRDLVIGKGGNMANDFMFPKAMDLLQLQHPLPHLDRKRIAMVGDTLNTDIKGGQGFGMKTIFFSETGVHHMSDLKYYPEVHPRCHFPGVRELVALMEGTSKPVVV